MEEKTSILFLGDVVPYRSFKFRNTYKTVINLESPITDDMNPVKGKINLRVKKNYLRDIFENNLFCACIGNNHILDFGKKGLDSTLNELQKINVKCFGLINESEEKFHPLIIDFNDTKIAFISAVCQSTSPVIALDNVIYLSLLNPDELIHRVLKIRNLVHRVVVYIHWGLEESSYPAKSEILIARKLITAGVDIVIGSHAHAPQPIENFNNGIIAYNLGNFIMPEMKNVPSYFNDGGVPHSTYNKRLMIWNRISWGLIINMETLEYRIKKYIFIFNRIIELPFTPLDKYMKLDRFDLNESYELFLKEHLKKRKLYRKISDFIFKPHVPQIVKKYYGNRSFIKFK